MTCRRKLQATLSRRLPHLLPPTDQPPNDPVPASSSAALVSSSANPSVVNAFAGEAEKLRDELKEHHVPFSETDVTAIIAIGEEAVARNVPDLSADDPAITERVALPGNLDARH
jgi:hypothetical protein